MDLNQAMQFIRWDQSRRSSARGEQRAQEAMVLSQEKFALSKAQYGLAERKFAFDYVKELQRMRQKEIDNDKYVISSFTDSYNKAKTLGEKNSIRETMRGYYETLNPSSRRALDSYIRHSPLSPYEEKRKEFLKLYSPPREPSVEDWKDKNYLRIAQYEFGKADFIAREKNFTTGTPIKLTNFVSLGDGTVAMRDDDKRINIYSTEELNLKDLAKKFNRSEGELLASGGVVTSKEPVGQMFSGGRFLNYHSQVNAFTGKTSTIIKPGTSIALPSPTKLPAKTQTTIEAIIGNDEDNLFAMELRDLIEGSSDDQALAAAQLSTMSGGFSFSFRTEKASVLRRLVNWIPFVGWLFKDAQTSIGIAAVEGTRTRLPVPGFGDKIVYIDNYDRVFDEYGISIGGSPEEAAARIAEELKRLKKE